jgi:hypothetical protein
MRDDILKAKTINAQVDGLICIYWGTSGQRMTIAGAKESQLFETALLTSYVK